MALEVGSPQQASAFVANCLATGRIVMGMGHREYRVVDPRSRAIRSTAQQIAKSGEAKQLFEVLCAIDEAFVEQTRTRKRSLRANLEFYKGVVYLALDIPKELFTACFAAARVFGWVAHVVEQGHGPCEVELARVRPEDVLAHLLAESHLGQALMTRIEMFDRVGGFDEALPAQASDVDYGLRVCEAGLRVVYTPYARLTHHESGGLSQVPVTSAERAHLEARWGARLAADPYYNPNLTRLHLDYRLA